MQLISFIASVMTLCLFIWKSCVYTCWKKWRPFFLVIHQQSLMKSIFAENGRILGKSTKGAKFLLILTALFGHQPTCKNFRGNADWNYTNKLVISMKTCTGLRNLLKKNRIRQHLARGRFRGDWPLKPTKIALFTMILYKSENIIRDIKPFCGPLFCQRSVVKYTSPPVVNP